MIWAPVTCSPMTLKNGETKNPANQRLEYNFPGLTKISRMKGLFQQQKNTKNMECDENFSLWNADNLQSWWCLGFQKRVGSKWNEMKWLLFPFVNCIPGSDIRTCQAMLRPFPSAGVFEERGGAFLRKLHCRFWVLQAWLATDRDGMGWSKPVMFGRVATYPLWKINENHPLNS